MLANSGDPDQTPRSAASDLVCPSELKVLQSSNAFAWPRG